MELRSKKSQPHSGTLLWPLHLDHCIVCVPHHHTDRHINTHTHTHTHTHTLCIKLNAHGRLDSTGSKTRNATTLPHSTQHCTTPFCVGVARRLYWITLHYITLKCTTLLCTTLQYTTPHCNTLHCTTLQYTTLHCNSLHCITLHCNTLHCTAIHYTAPHCTALHCTTLHWATLHHTALHYTALHCTEPHCITLHCTASKCRLYYISSKDYTVVTHLQHQAANCRSGVVSLLVLGSTG